jgi:plastocyanin
MDISKEGTEPMVGWRSAQVWRLAALLAVSAGTLGAQGEPGVVSGQITIQERPGDITEDMANTVVFLEPATGAARQQARMTTRAVMSLDKRQFSPRVAVVMAGSSIEFPNKDPFSHNVFSKANGGFDTGVYGRNKSRDQKFEEPGVYPLYCNVHPRMTAFVITLDTPLYTQAGRDGRFRITGVPAGQYRMTVWHDRATAETRDITVPAGGVSDLRITIDARGYKYVQHKNKHGKDYTSATGDRY